MRKGEKHQLLRYISDIHVGNDLLQQAIRALADKIWLTQPSDDPFQELITGNFTELEYEHYGKPKGFIWNPKIKMWMRHTGPCQNCGWQPGDRLQPQPPVQEVNPDGSLTKEIKP